MIRTPRILVLILVSAAISQLWARQAGTRKAPGTPPSADVGLLLGLYFPKNVTWNMLQNAGGDEKWVPEISLQPHGTYLTFWISRRSGSMTIKPIVGLLVPRKDGFWRIGSRMVQSAPADDDNFDEYFWAAPAGQKTPPELPKTDAEINGMSTRLITYAGPEYISYLSHRQGGAGNWEYQFTYVSPLDHLTKKLSIAQVLGAQAGANYKKLAKSLDHMNDDLTETQDRDPCNCCTGDENEWGVIHVHDRWEAYARFHPGTSSSCFQGWQDSVLQTSLPQSLWSGGRSSQPWDASRKQVESALKADNESAQHLFLSPRQDVAVALTTNGVVVFDVRNRTQFSVLKKDAFTAPCIPVSEQWSTGKFVATWNAEMQKQKAAVIPQEENR